jgi:hypothetical protein
VVFQTMVLHPANNVQHISKNCAVCITPTDIFEGDFPPPANPVKVVGRRRGNPVTSSPLRGLLLRAEIQGISAWTLPGNVSRESCNLIPELLY